MSEQNTTRPPVAAGQSIDTPEFRVVLHRLLSASSHDVCNARLSLIAHIDAALAHQRQEGRRDQHETHVVLLNENMKLQDALARAAAPAVGKETDLSKRLREHDDPRLYREADVLMSEAAAEIDRLSAASPAQQVGERKAWARWIARRGTDLPDHACAECVPHSDMLKPGFQCVYHEALAALAAPQPAQQGEDPLRVRIREINENYERMGETCSFEGEPMVHASYITELAELAAAPHSVSDSAAQDAGRYRALRDAKQLPGWVWNALESGEGLDHAVDSLIACNVPMQFCAECKQGNYRGCLHAIPCTLPAAPTTQDQEGGRNG